MAEQLYMLEIFIDKVDIFLADSKPPEPGKRNSAQMPAKKRLIIKVNFGPNSQFIIKENQLVKDPDFSKPDTYSMHEKGKMFYSRSIRTGKSYVFPAQPDSMLLTMSTFPLMIEIWTDDEEEDPVYIGVGNMHWDTGFFHYVQETTETCVMHESLAIKSKTALMDECCCSQVGEITFILRLFAIGNSIITEFQHLKKNPTHYVFRTNKAPQGLFDCTPVAPDDPNMVMTGTLYEAALMEDPDYGVEIRPDVCEGFQACTATNKVPPCEHEENDAKKQYPIEKIRMGDITGPCGNTSCPLAHKIKVYIRNLDSYKTKAGKIMPKRGPMTSRKVCGSCTCKDNKWHTDPYNDLKPKTMCEKCGGLTRHEDTCADRKNKLFGTTLTPSPSKTHVGYVFIAPSDGFKKAVYGQNFIVQNCYRTQYDNQITNYASTSQNTTNDSHSICGCTHDHEFESSDTFDYTTVANVTKSGFDAISKSARTFEVYNCNQITDEKDCSCNPPKPTPPCNTFDCECIANIEAEFSRKAHRPYCPSYIHKPDCPITMMNATKPEKGKDEDEDEAEPLPYGLPPIQLGPCPVMGRPCSVPDGFARMYKNAQTPQGPPSHSDAGKVCCSKEFKRIKDAIKEYMKYEKESDFRCLNKFNVDTEKRCCDKEQLLLSLMGKGCCGAHKMAIREGIEPRKPPPS